MPRRRASGQTDSNRIKQRVRTGCKTCRTRRVKCDETKPHCRNCSQRGLACDNSVQLKWEQEFADRGLAFGREGRWSKSQKPQSEVSYTKAGPASVVERRSFPLIQVHLFINFGYWDFDDRFEAGRECGDMLDVEGTSEESENAQVVAWPISPTPCAYPSLANIDSHLLDYFLIRLCPLTTSSRLTPSPFAQLVIPLFSIPGQDDILRAVLALSARHRCIGDLQWSRSAMNLKGEVITSLRKRLLSAETPESDSSWDPQILVMMMFLCLYEIVDNCDHRWVIHLRASKEIIQRSRQLKATHFGKDFGGLTAFTERFFAFQDVISRTACGNSALFGVEYWADADHPGHIDSWMGCSPDLVSILCRIAEVSRLKTGDDISADFLERESAELEQRLEAMQVRTDDRSSDDDALLLAAELKRKSVLLYHHCVLYDACPSTPFVCQLKRDILEGICELVEAGLAAGLAFPIFVAAVELHPTDDQEFLDKRTGELVCGRRLVLETLEVMAKLSLSNISRTRAVIQKVWRMRDMALEDCHSLSLRTGVNDWSIFVGPYSANISLS